MGRAERFIYRRYIYGTERFIHSRYIYGTERFIHSRYIYRTHRIHVPRQHRRRGPPFPLRVKHARRVLRVVDFGVPFRAALVVVFITRHRDERRGRFAVAKQLVQ